MRKRSLWRRILFWVAAVVAGFYVLCGAALVGLKWIDPPITMVQIQRRMEAAIHRRPYRKRYVFVPLGRISKELQHAVIASEDERFYQHHGIDWTELHKVVDRDMDRGKLGRGASTITQQLVKNLFLTTSRSVVRKAIEFTISAGRGLDSGKAARAGALSERDRMGSRDLWCGGRRELLVQHAGGAARAGGVRAAGGYDPVAIEAQARAHAGIERRHLRKDARIWDGDGGGPAHCGYGSPA